MASAIFTSRLPVVTARMPVRKERSCGSAHAEVFLCRRNVWVALPPRSWSASRRGWQNTAPCSRGEGLAWGLPPPLPAGPGLAVPAGCSADGPRCVRQSVPRFGTRCVGGSHGQGWREVGTAASSPRKNDPRPSPELFRGESGHKALGREPDRAPALRRQGREGRTDFWEVFAVAGEQF